MTQWGGGGRKGRGRTWKRKNSGQSKARALVSKGGSSDASVQATLCQPVHGTSFELNSFASMFYLFLSCPPPSLCHGFLTLQGLPRRCNFFCWVNFPSPNLPQHGPFQLQTRTFQKNIAQGEAKNKPKAKIFQKPTPKWETIKRRENHAEAYTWMRY